MRKTTWVAAAAAAALTWAAGPRESAAELIELTSGSALQGDVLPGQTTEEGLALNLYDTNGVVIVKWEHIIETRRRQLRLEYGIDLPEETQEMVPGHRVLLTTGEMVLGVAENPRDSQPLRLKTRGGVKTYDRSTLAGPVEDTMVDGLLVYTKDELYQRIRDENPPETAAAHKALAQRCINVGAYDRAKEHLVAAASDPAFVGTTEGKAVDAMLRQCELMLRAQGAKDLSDQIRAQMYGNRWNDALKSLEQLAKDFPDEQIRKAVGFELLENKVVKGRDTYFQRKVPLEIFRAMDYLLDTKSRERKPLRADTSGAAPGAQQGTLAAARQWSGRELYAQIWDKVSGDLQISKEEAENYWKARSVKQVRRASYGTGSFIVIKKAPAARSSGQTERRRPPGSERDRSAPARPQKVEKPKTEEEWFEAVSPSDRKQWLTANFVETSGMFEIVRVDEPSCESCGGRGFTVSTDSAGGEEQHFCVQCNTAGKFRTVSYR